MRKDLEKELGEEKIQQLKKKNKMVKKPDFDNSPDPVDQYIHYKMYDWGNNVLNGVAYVAEDDTFLITGKMWDHIYKVKLDYRDFVVSNEDTPEYSDEL